VGALCRHTRYGSLVYSIMASILSYVVLLVITFHLCAPCNPNCDVINQSVLHEITMPLCEMLRFVAKSSGSGLSPAQALAA
jgi:hypothetical protein